MEDRKDQEAIEGPAEVVLVVAEDQAEVVLVVTVLEAEDFAGQVVVTLEVNDQGVEIEMVDEEVQTVVQEIEMEVQTEDQVRINQDIEDVNTILF